LSFAPIVFAVLFSLARADQTAFASHSGESGVNGFISPVICQRADITAVGDTVIVDTHVQKAFAPIVPFAVTSISLVQEAVSDPITSPVGVITISQVPFDDTTSDRFHNAVTTTSHVPSQFTHITGFAVLDN
jgi:hypothetical protein